MPDDAPSHGASPTLLFQPFAVKVIRADLGSWEWYGPQGFAWECEGRMVRVLAQWGFAKIFSRVVRPAFLIHPSHGDSQQQQKQQHTRNNTIAASSNNQQQRDHGRSCLSNDPGDHHLRQHVHGLLRVRGGVHHVPAVAVQGDGGPRGRPGGDLPGKRRLGEHEAPTSDGAAAGGHRGGRPGPPEVLGRAEAAGVRVQPAAPGDAQQGQGRHRGGDAAAAGVERPDPGLDSTDDGQRVGPAGRAAPPAQLADLVREAIEQRKGSHGASIAMAVSDNLVAKGVVSSALDCADQFAELQKEADSIRKAKVIYDEEILEAVKVLSTPRAGVGGSSAVVPPKLKPTPSDTVRAVNECLVCPISREIMHDPVTVLESGLTYDRKSLCTSLLLYPDLEPVTLHRYDGPLSYTPSIAVRNMIMAQCGDSYYEKFDDAEFQERYKAKWKELRKSVNPGSAARRKRVMVAGAVVFLLVVIAGAVAGVILSRPPTPTPSIIENFNATLPPSTTESLRNMSSAQYRAYKWAIEKDEVPERDTQNDEARLFRMRQRFAMATLFFSLGLESSVGATESECEWGSKSKITCIGDSLVTEINTFVPEDHGGPIPREIGFLTTLTLLNMSLNSLTSSIPTELGHLSALTSLSLYNNSLTSSIPAELGRLNALVHLDLYGNSLASSIPTELGSLTALLVSRPFIEFPDRFDPY
jgi:U-box domain